MLRRFCTANGGGSSSSSEATDSTFGGPVTPPEMMALRRLVESHRALLSDHGLTDVRSEAGYAACANFLSEIDRVARAMRLPTASRAYRRSFSANYRALFPDNARLYRVDVLETALDQHSEIWVNGEKFELSSDAMSYATALQQAWTEIMTIVGEWRNFGLENTLDLAEVERLRPHRTELAAALLALDVAWAQFENKYICELIAIEERARQLIVSAADVDFKLLYSEDFVGANDKAQDDLERQLVACIAHINAVANYKCKGRDDLGHDILLTAKRIMKEVEAQRAQYGEDNTECRAAASLLASEVIAAFQSVRLYLRRVRPCMERVDPHLCNNPGLVTRLVDWETSWEIGARYVRDIPLLDAICDIVSAIKSAQTIVPSLTDMCEDCDVELFLVLPRLVVLLYVADPSAHRSNLVRSMLPHRFVSSKYDQIFSGRPNPSLELHSLYRQFNLLHQEVSLVHPAAVSHSAPMDMAWEILLKRAIQGHSDLTAAEKSGCPADTAKRIEEFMLGLERWSVELQRHCPQDWNQCSAVLVQCITGHVARESRVPTEKFQI